MSRRRVDVEMLELVKAEPALCKVKEGEVVAVLTGGEDPPEYAQTFMLAATANDAGGPPALLVVPRVRIFES
jgi:hypothetical protein